MRIAVVVILLASVTRTPAKDQDSKGGSGDTLADNLLDRASRLPPQLPVDVDSTTWGKSGHLVFSLRKSSGYSFPLGASHSESRVGRPHRILAAIHRLRVASWYAASLQLDPRNARGIECLAAAADASVADKCVIPAPAETLQRYLQLQATVKGEPLPDDTIEAIVRQVEASARPVDMTGPLQQKMLGDWQVCWQTNVSDDEEKTLSDLPQFQNFVMNEKGSPIFRNELHVTKNRVRVVADISYTWPEPGRGPVNRLYCSICAAAAQISFGRRFGLKPLGVPLPLGGYQGWLDVIYLSDEMRIVRGNRGGIFIHLRPNLLRKEVVEALNENYITITERVREACPVGSDAPEGVEGGQFLEQPHEQEPAPTLPPDIIYTSESAPIEAGTGTAEKPMQQLEPLEVWTDVRKVKDVVETAWLVQSDLKMALKLLQKAERNGDAHFKKLLRKVVLGDEKKQFGDNIAYVRDRLRVLDTGDGRTGIQQQVLNSQQDLLEKYEARATTEVASRESARGGTAGGDGTTSGHASRHGSPLRDSSMDSSVSYWKKSLEKAASLTINSREYENIQLIKAMLEERHGDLSSAFRYIDDNNSKHVTLTELIKGLSELGVSSVVSESVFRKLITLSHCEGRGALNLQDWLVSFEKAVEHLNLGSKMGFEDDPEVSTLTHGSATAMIGHTGSLPGL